MSARRVIALALLAFVVLALAVLVLMDWNWLRGPAERLASSTLGRDVRIGHLAVQPGLTTTVRLRDLRVANTDWGEVQPMLRARELEFSIRLWSLIVPPRVLPQLRITDADLSMERLQDGRANWEFEAFGGDEAKAGQDDGDPAPSIELRGLRVDGGRLAYRDAKLNIRADAHAQTRNDPRYPTLIEFAGDWRGASFGGKAEAGSVLSLRNSNQPFALRLDMKAGATTLKAEGEVTDLATWGRIDVQLAIAGPSLASLYPTLRLALPASPPYRFDGRLTKEGNRYGYGSFSGVVGRSDITGDGELLIQEPRPRLTAQLRSQRLDLDDLGPLIGVGAAEAAMARGRRPEQATPAERRANPPGRENSKAQKKQASRGEPGSTAAASDFGLRRVSWHIASPPSAPHSPRSWMPPPRRETPPKETAREGSSLPLSPVKATPARKRNDGQSAKAREAQRATTNASGGRVLPTADFSGERLSVIDADVSVDVDRLLLPAKSLTVQDLRARVLLDDGALKLEPLRMSFAGGDVLGAIQLDGRASPNRLRASIDFRRLQLAQLVGSVDTLKQTGGRLGAQIRLTGDGASVADILGSANGRVTVGMAGGQISHLALAAASLNGGRLIQLMLGGDRPSEIRCAGAALDIKDGIGDVTAFVFDTEHVRIDGDGQLNLKRERFDFTLTPKPKSPNILSVRAPVHVRGSFRDIDISLDSSAVARAGAAAALALVNPLAALIPLIETGPGEDTHCGQVLAPVKGAAEQARNPSQALPAPPGKSSGK